MSTKRRQIMGLAGAVIVLSPLIWAQPLGADCTANETQKLIAGDGDLFDQFGFSAAVSGDVAVIGAFNDDPTGAGSVYVFRFDGTSWSQEQKLTASDGQALDQFGVAVAVDDDVIAVGAYFDDDLGNVSGAAYVFRFNGSTWVEEQKLTASDGAEGDLFGHSVGVSGDIVVVGAESQGADNKGAAYVFRYDGMTWTQDQKLTASDGAVNDSFGRSVAADGDAVLVGAEFANGGAGSAYVFRFDGTMWTQEQELVPGTGTNGYGISVSLSGGVALIGAYLDLGVNGSGSAFVFRFDGSSWNEDQEIIPSDGAGNDFFGTSVGVDGNVALVGSPADDDGATNAGSVYVYHYDGADWNEAAKLTASDPANFNNLGQSAGVSDGVAVSGAYQDDDIGSNSGSAYVFSGLDDCNTNGEIDLCDLDDGSSTDDDGDGVPDECGGGVPECAGIVGDVNGDGSIDGDDAQAFVDCVLTGMTDGGNCDCADLNGDGSANEGDVALMVETLLATG